MTKSNLVQVNLSISQDWSTLTSVYKKILELWRNDKLPNLVQLTDIGACHYDLGDLGSLTVLDMISAEKKKASFLHGKIVENKLSWLPKLKQDMSELNLESVCLFYSNQDILKHEDQSGVIQSRNDICKINFFIENSNSRFFIEDQGVVESVPAVANTAWLCNVVNTHWATIPDELFLFQLCFYNPFDQVLEWLNAHPELNYS